MSGIDEKDREAIDRDRGLGSESGFAQLWHVITADVRRRIIEQAPDKAREFLQTCSVPEESGKVAAEIGFPETPLLKAIERGAAYRGALFRLTNANRAAGLLRADPGRVGVIESVLLDSLNVYLSAYIDATRNFAHKAMGQLLPEDEDTRKRREDVAAWASARKNALSSLRQVVAHADVTHIAGIEEDGLWTPMILLGLAEEEVLVEMFSDGIKQDHEKFDWRVGRLLETAVRAMAEGDQQLELTARLVKGKRNSNET